MLGNRRGQIWIEMLVLLVVVTVLASVFIFLTSSKKVDLKISDARVVEGIYLKEGVAEFYVEDASLKALFKTYEDILNEQGYVHEPVYSSEKKVMFRVLDFNLDEKIRESFEKNLRGELLNYDLDELKDASLEVKVGRDFLVVGLNLEINSSFGDVDVLYFPRIVEEIDFYKEGFFSFEDVYDVKEECKDSVDVEGCFNEGIEGYSASVTGEGDFVYVLFESERDFFVDGVFRKLVFGFVVK